MKYLWAFLMWIVVLPVVGAVMIAWDPFEFEYKEMAKRFWEVGPFGNRFWVWWV